MFQPDDDKKDFSEERRDLWQDAILLVLESVKKYQPGQQGSFGAYLKKTLNNRFMARFERRRQKSITAEFSLDSLPENGSDIIPEEPQEDTAALDASLFAAIDRLTEKRRRILLDYYLHSKKQKEIARTEGISANAVTMQVHHAIEAIRAELSDLSDEV